MSILVFPDGKNTEWISWNRLSKKSARIENGHFRWTSEKFCDYSNTLPVINISPLNLALKPLKEARKSCPRPFNSGLVIPLPPFSGSIKSRNNINSYSRPKNFTREVSQNKEFLLSDSIPKANFLRFMTKEKGENNKKIRKISNYARIHRQRLEGIVGVKLLSDGFEDRVDKSFYV